MGCCSPCVRHRDGRQVPFHQQPRPGIKEEVRRHKARRHEDPVWANGDLEGHGGKVHIEWNGVWRPIWTPQRPPPITPQSAPEIPAQNVRGLKNVARRRLHHHRDDRRGPGHRPDEEKSALGEIFEGPALRSMERTQLGGLQSICCIDGIGRSDVIGFWE